VDFSKEVQIQLERITIPARKPVVVTPSATPKSKNTPSTSQRMAAGIKRAYSLRSTEPGTKTSKVDASRTLRLAKQATNL